MNDFTQISQVAEFERRSELGRTWSDPRNAWGAVACVWRLEKTGWRDIMLELIEAVLAPAVFDMSMPGVWAKAQARCSEIVSEKLAPHATPSMIAWIALDGHDLAEDAFRRWSQTEQAATRMRAIIAPWKHRDIAKNDDQVKAFEALVRIDRIAMAYRFWAERK